MGRTVIVSEDTIRSLATANAALAAWYHELVRAAREQTPVVTPTEETRTAFLRRLADELPEIAAVVRSLGPCPIHVPAPLAFAPRAEPVQPPTFASPPQQASREPEAARPPLVNPREVKY